MGRQARRSIAGQGLHRPRVISRCEAIGLSPSAGYSVEPPISMSRNPRGRVAFRSAVAALPIGPSFIPISGRRSVGCVASARAGGQGLGGFKPARRKGGLITQYQRRGRGRPKAATGSCMREAQLRTSRLVVPAENNPEMRPLESGRQRGCSAVNEWPWDANERRRTAIGGGWHPQVRPQPRQVKGRRRRRGSNRCWPATRRVRAVLLRVPGASLILMQQSAVIW